ncbi:Oryzin [Orbilia brochopaga]|nr:Oryzin [Drechslerella brochopaga]
MFSKLSLISFLTVAGLATNTLAGPILKIANAGSQGLIADKYIVVLKKQLTDAQAQAHTSRIASFHSNVARDLSGPRSHGVENQFKFDSTGFRGYTGGFDFATLQQILRSPEVDYVEQDGIVTASDAQTGTTWGLDRISHKGYTGPVKGGPDDVDIGSNYKYEYDESTAGAGVTVYVIDTGVRTTHTEFQDSRGKSRAEWGFNSVDKSWSDGNGHGTHCAGTIAGKTYGVSKNAHIKAVKVLNAGGSGTYAGVVAGMDWVAKDAVGNNTVNRAVASMSLGGGKSDAINQAGTSMFKAGVVLVVAAGNENQDVKNVSPASTPEALTVGALDKYNTIASFSNWGAGVDVFAPGVNVTSSWGSGDTATNKISGTSMACPHVAGLAAYYISQQLDTASPPDITKLIAGNAVSGVKGNIHDSPNLIAYNGFA